MDWNLFWTAFGAIGGTLAALATTAAVIVALWQVKYNKRKKLKLQFSDSMVLFETSQPFISLDITNTGNREVIIDKWGFIYSEKNGYALIGLKKSTIEKQINPHLPYKLALEESISLYWEFSFFVRSIKTEIGTGHLQSNKKITFFTSDSTGKKYTVFAVEFRNSLPSPCRPI